MYTLKPVGTIFGGDYESCRSLGMQLGLKPGMGQRMRSVMHFP